MSPSESPPCGHPWAGPPVAGCTYCRLRDHPFHRERWKSGRVVAARTWPLCLHLGAVVPAADVRQHFVCEKGRGTVRPCCDCGPGRCPDYDPDA